MPKRTSKSDCGNVEVTRFLAHLNDSRTPALEALRKIIRGIDPTIGEEIKWKMPSFYTIEHFATMNLRPKGGIALILHFGAKANRDIDRIAIDDSEHLLKWLATDRAMLEFSSIDEILAQQSAVEKILRQWMDLLVRIP